MRGKWENRALILLLPQNLLFGPLNFLRLLAPDPPSTSLDHSVSCVFDSLTSSTVYGMTGGPCSQICLTADFLCLHAGWPRTAKRKSFYPDSEWNVHMRMLSLILGSPVLPSPLIPVSKNCVCVLSHFSHVQLFDPMGCNLPGSSVHGDSPGKSTGVGGMPSSWGSSYLGTKPVSLLSPPLAVGSLPLVPTLGKPQMGP